jgi:hypothetical protein
MFLFFSYAHYYGNNKQPKILLTIKTKPCFMFILELLGKTSLFDKKVLSCCSQTFFSGTIAAGVGNDDQEGTGVT